MAVGPEGVPAVRRAAGVETGRLRHQHIGQFGMASCADLVLGARQFGPGSADVDSAGIGESGGLPRNRPGQDEVHLAGSVAVAEGLQGPAVAAGKGIPSHVHQPSGRDDAGAAVAAFVGANLGALQGEAVTPRMLRALERQLHGIARVSSGWKSAPLVERQAYFEQMALLAVLVGESAVQAGPQGPEAVARVRQAARGYLHQLLGLDPDHLALGPEGLAVRLR